MSYLRDLCLLEYNGVLHIFCSVFLRRVIPYAASFFWIVLFDCPFDIL